MERLSRSGFEIEKKEYAPVTAQRMSKRMVVTASSSGEHGLRHMAENNGLSNKTAHTIHNCLLNQRCSTGIKNCTTGYGKWTEPQG